MHSYKRDNFVLLSFSFVQIIIIFMGEIATLRTLTGASTLAIGDNKKHHFHKIAHSD
jgi:hypothetical protein